MEEIIKKIAEQAHSKIDKDCNQLILELNKHTGTLLGDFASRVLSWYFDKNKIYLLHDLFDRVFASDSLHFLENFYSFFVNCLLDDSSFEVYWRVLFKGTKNFVELASKPLEEYYVAEPIIIERPDGRGRQDVKLLLDAMDEIEKVQEERVRRDEQLKRNLDDIMGYL